MNFPKDQMTEKEARELMVAFSHNPVSLETVKANWDPVDDFVVVVEATGGGQITLRDVESGRKLAREIAAHETQVSTRCGILNEDGSVTQCGLHEWAGRDFGYQRSLKEVECSLTVKAVRFFGGITNELDGPARFWKVNFIDAGTGQTYGGHLSFETSNEADDFVSRYVAKGRPAEDTQEFADI